MPIYEYKCLNCKKRFEKIHLSTSSIDVECPKCGSSEVEKELSTFASGGDDRKSNTPIKSGGHGHSGMG